MESRWNRVHDLNTAIRTTGIVGYQHRDCGNFRNLCEIFLVDGYTANLHSSSFASLPFSARGHRRERPRTSASSMPRDLVELRMDTNVPLTH